MSNAEQSPDEFFDEIVSDYIQEQIATGQAAGQTADEIEQSFNAASLILSVKMLQKRGSGHLPEGSELLHALGELTDASEAECRQMCRAFIHAGWMDAGYGLTESGRQLAGLTPEPG
ncbi:MAG TPA: hypothetical protein V6D23_19080 [Candidatus Obscuribacterales bacterium]